MGSKPLQTVGTIGGGIIGGIYGGPAGAAAGSAAGGAIGGALSGPDKSPQQAAAEGAGDAVQAAHATQVQQSAFIGANMNNQYGINNALYGQAMNTGVDPATQSALQQNAAAQIGLAKSQKGGNQALAARNASHMAQANNQSAVLGAGMQHDARLMNYANFLSNQQGYNANMTGTAANAALGLASNSNAVQQMQNQQQGGIMSGIGAALPLFFNKGASSGNQAGGGMAGGVGDAGSMASQMQNAAHGGEIKSMPNGPASRCGSHFMTMKSGGPVPGANQGGTTDSLKNDTVPTMLSPGEAVIPKSIMNGPNAAQNAAKFVQAILAKKGM